MRSILLYSMMTITYFPIQTLERIRGKIKTLRSFTNLVLCHYILSDLLILFRYLCNISSNLMRFPGSTRKYSRDYSLSEIDVQLDTMS